MTTETLKAPAPPGRTAILTADLGLAWVIRHQARDICVVASTDQLGCGSCVVVESVATLSWFQ